MIICKRDIHLTKHEMEGLAGTSVYADLLMHKYYVASDTATEIDTLVSELNDILQSVWHFSRCGQSQGANGHIYVSTEEDSAILAAFIHENQSTHIDTQ